MDTKENTEDVQLTDRETMTVAIGAATHQRGRKYVESRNYKEYLGRITTIALQEYLDRNGG